MDRVLICTADGQEFETLQRILHGEAECVRATDGAAVLQALQAKNMPVAAAIIDLDAAPQAGLAVHVLSEGSAAAALPFALASADPAREPEALEAGAQYLIRKPFVDAAVRAEVRALLRSKQYSALKEMADDQDYDSVSGQFRLERFYRIVEQAVAKRPDCEYTVISFDINHFKLFNDFYGRETGNAIIREGSAILRAYEHCIALARSDQSVSFCMLVDCSAEHFLADYPYLDRQLNDTFGTIPLEMTLGLCDYEIGYDTPEMAYEKADFAHKHAKNAGSGVYQCIYDDSLRQKRHRKQFILSRFNEAIQNHEFIPYIQPKYNLYTDSFSGGEVLCRWVHKGAMISPGEFIPVLEENGLIAKLDRYMFSETLKIIKGWINHKIMPQPLSVNLSRINFYKNDLAEDILSMIDELGVPHSLIQIEITESAYVELEDRVIRFVDTMLEKGIQILMDDFGSGYSSLNMLRSINVSYLKVDCRFLEKSRIPARREQMLESIVKMARTIRVPVVVEGVETVQDATLLKSLGVRYVQGFLYARPMPLAEFDALPHKGSAERARAVFATALLDRLRDARSSTRHLFDLSLSNMALCEYSRGALYLVQMNPAMQSASAADLNDLLHNRRDLLAFVAPQDRTHVETHIRDVCRQLAVNDFVECDFVTPVATPHLKLRFTLLAQRSDGYTLLMDVLKLYDVQTKAESTPLFEMLDRIDRGYYIMGQNHEILYLNPRAKQILPNFVPGVKCTDFKRYDEDCTQCPLDNYDMPMSYYSQALNAFIENYVTEIRLNGETVKLVRIDLNSGEVLSTSDSVMRMNRAMALENDVYTEVNLETLRYQQITFAKRKTFDIPTEGDYTENYEDMLERQIDKATQRDVLRYFSAEGMRREFAVGKRIKARFRFAGLDKWGECVGTFLRDRDTRYCCVYTHDITGEVLRDCDGLTGLPNIAAIRHIVNDELTENPSRAAALFMLDFDNFKAINDNYGHPFGDRVLAALADCLREANDGTTTPARVGGDEFAVFVRDASDLEHLSALRTGIQQRIAALSAELKIDTMTSVSVGTALYPADAQTFTELYAEADRRMYIDKAHAHHTNG